ncbi:unnamed protein product [Sympodiomycopsis kandeliae]
MSIRISSGSDLDFLLHCSDHRDRLNAQELWLSSFEGVTQLSGAYAKKEHEGPRKAVASATKPWRQVTKYLAQQCGPDRPLSHLALHTSAQYSINRDVLTRKGNASKNELLKSRAAKTHVKRLTLSGRGREDYYWPFLQVSECITLRGCLHAIREAFWWGLIKLQTDPPILRFELLGPVFPVDIICLMRELMWVQRIRHFLGLEQFLKSGNGRVKAEDYPPGKRHFATVMILTELDEPLPAWLTEELWNEYIPKVYTTGTRVILHNVPKHVRQLGAISGIPELEKQLFTTGPSNSASARSVSDSSTSTAWPDGSDQTLVDEESPDPIIKIFPSKSQSHLVVTPVSPDRIDSYSHGAMCSDEVCKCGPSSDPVYEASGPESVTPCRWIGEYHESDYWSDQDKSAICDADLDNQLDAWDLLNGLYAT